MKIAYLLTFRCYGTWLHGDERGSVDDGRNIYGDARIEPSEALRLSRQNKMNGVSQKLDTDRRKCVEVAVREVAAHRGWNLHELNARSNHVHMVIGGEATAEKMMNDCKAYATRRLRRLKLLPQMAHVWSEHGSTVYLWDCLSFEAACDYVRNQQDEPKKPTEPEA